MPFYLPQLEPDITEMPLYLPQLEPEITECPITYPKRKIYFDAYLHSCLEIRGLFLESHDQTLHVELDHLTLGHEVHHDGKDDGVEYRPAQYLQNKQNHLRTPSGGHRNRPYIVHLEDTQIRCEISITLANQTWICKS